MSGGWVCACSSCSPVPVSSLLSQSPPAPSPVLSLPGFDQLPLLAPHIQSLRWGLSLVHPSTEGERRAMKETLLSCSNSSSVSLSSSSHVPCMPSSSSSSSSKSSNPNSRPLAFARAGDDGPSHVTCWPPPGMRQQWAGLPDEQLLWGGAKIKLDVGRSDVGTLCARKLVTREERATSMIVRDNLQQDCHSKFQPPQVLLLKKKRLLKRNFEEGDNLTRKTGLTNVRWLLALLIIVSCLLLPSEANAQHQHQWCGQGLDQQVVKISSHMKRYKRAVTQKIFMEMKTLRRLWCPFLSNEIDITPCQSGQGFTWH